MERVRERERERVGSVSKEMGHAVYHLIRESKEREKARAGFLPHPSWVGE